MVKVEMPRAQWDMALYLIEEAAKDPRWNPTVINILHKEIEDQVYSQEY